ncbi:MAG TPA: hypothetical protein PLP48_07745 [Acholeplasmataceae bacterium]|nr:hypothetical protein [Acholeplasmataceae bacterium]
MFTSKNFKFLTITLLLLLFVSILYACDSRKELSEDAEIELIEKAKNVILDETSWNDNILLLSQNGVLILHDDISEDYLNATLENELNQFQILLTQIFSNDTSLILNGGFYVNNSFYLLSVLINIYSIEIIELNIRFFSDINIIIEPVYKDDTEIQIIGVIFNVDLNLLHSNKYGSEYND